MGDLHDILERERKERLLGYAGAVGLFSVVMLVLAAWYLYL